MVYKITCTTIDWVKADSKEEAMNKWAMDDTDETAEPQTIIEEEPDFY